MAIAEVEELRIDAEGSVTTSTQIVRAYFDLRDDGLMTEPFAKMMAWHSAHPESTMEQIGAACGYDYSAANLQYGTLAHMIGDCIPGYQFGTYKSGKPWYLSLFGCWYPDEHVLVMHPAVARAIRILVALGEL